MLILALLMTVHGAFAIDVHVAKPGSEQFERNVDQVALASQDNAVAKLTGLLKKYEKTSQEPVFLIKLAEIQAQSSAMLFRIAHGVAHNTKKPIDLSKFNRRMGEEIAILDRLISRYPDFSEIGHAWFLRGKAHEERGDKALATRDYTTLTRSFADSEEAPAAYMALAQFAIDAGNHAEAVRQLREVEKLPLNPHYPFALYKLAWAHYNLKSVPSALSYAERHVAYYSSAARGAETSDQALRENTLLDVALFYFQGYEDGSADYRLAGALEYFRKLDQGSTLGRMASRFGKLLRSHARDADLVTWKDQLLAEEIARPETLDVVITTFEHQLNRRRFADLVGTARDMAKLYARNKTAESFPRARKLVLDTADSLRGNESAALNGTLAGLYDAFTRIVDAADPRIPRVHYNLAEALFALRDYSGACQHYRWVVEHGKAIPDAALKAVAARYEVLKSRQLVPQTLEARAIGKSSEEKLDAELAEWITWVDETAAPNFAFEASRSLYRAGHLREAVDRLVLATKKDPASPFAIPSASLALDTRVAGEEWEAARDLAEELRPRFKSSEFAQKLFAIAADASYKLVEAEYKRHGFRHVLVMSESFLAKFATSVRLADCLSLAGNAAIETGERDRALGYFTRLIAAAPASANAPAALYARSQLEEDRYQFREAAADLRVYLGLSKEKAEAARAKVLALSWLAGAQELRSALAEKSVCADADPECARYGALLAGTDARVDAPTALAKAREATGSARAVWAATAISRARELPFRDRLLAAKLLAGAWGSLDPITRFALTPQLSESVPNAFALDRRAIEQVAPLKADPKAIRHRVEAIREIEEAAVEAARAIPWARVRARLLDETAGLYLDLARWLAAVDREIAIPFEEKGQDLRAKAFEAASKSSIEDESFQAISVPFFAENPSQAKKLRPSEKRETPVSLDLLFLARLEPSGPWETLAAGNEPPAARENPVLRVQSLWARALLARRWAQVAFFLHEAQEKALVQAGMMAAMKAISLVAAGARAEGLTELEESRRDLSPTAKSIAAQAIIQYSLYTSNRDRAKSLQDEARDDSALAFK